MLVLIQDYTYAFNDQYEKWYELNDNWVAEMDEIKICVINFGSNILNCIVLFLIGFHL